MADPINMNVTNANRQKLIELKSSVNQIKDDLTNILKYSQRTYQLKANGKEHEVTKPNTFSVLYRASIDRLKQYETQIDADCVSIDQFCAKFMSEGGLNDQGKIPMDALDTIQGSVSNLYKFILDEVAQLEKIEKVEEGELDSDVDLSKKLDNLKITLDADLDDKFEQAKKIALKEFKTSEELELKYTVLFEVKKQLESYHSSSPDSFNSIKTRINFVGLLNQANSIPLANIPEDVGRYLTSLLSA